jgi:hypothetical protein
MREFNQRADHRTTFPLAQISSWPVLVRVFRPLLACSTALVLTACAANAPQTQFLPWNLALTTDGVEACDRGCPQKATQTEAAPGESRPVSASWKSSVAVQPPFEYQPYQGERSQPADAQPQM